MGEVVDFKAVTEAQWVPSLEEMGLGLSMSDLMAFYAAQDFGVDYTSFSTPKLQTIWLAIVAVVIQSGTSDVVAVAAYLKDKGLLEEVGGLVYLSKLTNRV